MNPLIYIACLYNTGSKIQARKRAFYITGRSNMKSTWEHSTKQLSMWKEKFLRVGRLKLWFALNITRELHQMHLIFWIYAPGFTMRIFTRKFSPLFRAVAKFPQYIISRPNYVHLPYFVPLSATSEHLVGPITVLRKPFICWYHTLWLTITMRVILCVFQ